MKEEELTLLKKAFAEEIFDNCLSAVVSKLGKTPTESVELAKRETVDMWTGTFAKIPDLSKISYANNFAVTQANLHRKKEELIESILKTWQ